MNRTITVPGGGNCWGMQGEHNETTLVIELGAELSGCVSAVVTVARRDGVIIETAAQEPVNGKVSITLTQQMTACRGVIAAQVTAYNADGSVIGKSPVYSGELQPSLAAANADDDGTADIRDQIIAALAVISGLDGRFDMKKDVDAVWCAKWREEFGGAVTGYDDLMEMQDCTPEELEEFYYALHLTDSGVNGRFFAMPYGEDRIAYVSRYSQTGHAFNFFVPSLLRLGYSYFDDGNLAFEESNLGDVISSLMLFELSFANKESVLDKLSVGTQSLELEFDGEPVNKPTVWADITDKPSSFTPSAHTHTVGQVTGAEKSNAEKIAEFDAAMTEFNELRMTDADVFDSGEPLELTAAQATQLSNWITHHDYLPFCEAEDGLGDMILTKAYYVGNGDIWECTDGVYFKTVLDTESTPKTFAIYRVGVAAGVNGEYFTFALTDDISDTPLTDYPHVDRLVPTVGAVSDVLPKAISETAPSAVTLADNTEYRLMDVSSLTLTYPSGNFEVWIRLTTASSGTVTITLPSSSYIGDTPTFGTGETWEVSIKDGVVIAQKVVAPT